MLGTILNSKLRNIQLSSRLDSIKKSLMTVSKFSSAQVVVKGFSKFSSGEIKSEMDIQVPMDVELHILKVGQTKDGNIDEPDMEESLQFWSSLPIIDFHDMSDMNHPTNHKITDRKGYLGDNPRIKTIDGTKWIINDAQITDRYLAYLIYLHEKQKRPLEISAEFARQKIFKGTDMCLTNIKPHLISIVDKGEIKGNKIIIKK